MEKMNVLTLIITLVVGVILTGALLGPVVSDATKTTETFTNEGYFTMDKYGTDTEITIVWDPADAKSVSVNGEKYNPNTPVNQFVNIAIGDNWYFRYADGGGDNTYVQVSYGGVDLVAGSNTNGVSVSVTCSGGTATITKASMSHTMTYTELYVISDDGAYVMKNANETVTVAGDTEFIGLGVTSLGTGRAVLKVTGDVDNGADVTVIGSTPSEATISDVNVSATALDNYKGYSLSNVTFTVTMDSVDYPATYNYFIVPASVTLELTEHLTPGQISLIGAIPVMVIVALLMAAVGAIALRRAD